MASSQGESDRSRKRSLRSPSATRSSPSGSREREVLDHDFLEAGPVIRVRSDANYDAMFPNVAKLHRLAETLAEAARRRLRSGHTATEIDLALYEDVVCYVLYIAT